MGPKIKPFNGTYLICWGIAVILIVAIGLLLKKKDEKAKKTFLVGLCVVNIIVFFVYKGFLSVDRDFLAKAEIEGGFNWFNELPLQLCNINMFLIPIGLLTKKRGILGFSFFLAPLGATMALVFPEPAFQNEPLFMPRILGFYATHFLIVTAGISLATLGFFRPKFKDLPKVFLTLIVVSFGVHLVNLLLRATGICSYANYFFTMEDGGVSLLKLFAKITTVPFIYMLPSLLILAVYMGIISLVFFVVDKLKGVGNKASETPEKETVNA
ncbi:MAG TPA: hypothetical protein DEW35_01035 [Ruminococcaceae bacterium]|nr:hypothetical protein [Oscillospiraceae bacterium]